ncbi:hypothetical protein MMC10_009770 [Thelotrema lepadinum]|nr:hypothetical protein [Thelotrema lepadinum]
MSQSEEDSKQEARLLSRLKAALWFSIGKAVDEETLKHGINATPQFIGALTELVWAQIGKLCVRVRAFLAKSEQAEERR